MGKADKWRYGVVLDAGSSGTRVHIYRWLQNAVAREDDDGKHLKELPALETKDKWTKKVHPGVSSFAENPEDLGPDHLRTLVDHAMEYVPHEAIPDTPIFLLATAGVRLLPAFQRNSLLRQVCTYFKEESDFLITDCDTHVQAISGETEGLYGWIAANYLLGGFDAPEEHDHGKGHHTYGFLDMGGASAQIAFAPNATEAAKHANDLKLLRLRTINGESQEYRVFVTTWLGYGANEARRHYVDNLIETYDLEKETRMPDPCLPAGIKLTTYGAILPPTASNKVKYLVGTGKFDECLKRTLPLLNKDVPCLDEPCLFNGKHVPGIDFDVNHFIGISEYWHTTHGIFEMGHKDRAYDFNTYQTRVKEFCEQDWETIKAGIRDHTWGNKVDEQTAWEVCFKASWLISVLHDGIGIPRVGIEHISTDGHNGTKELLDGLEDKGYLEPFQAVNEIKSTEVSWTLGKMVLYASADVPVAEGTLPVGFGSNTKGVPADFQYPGGGTLQNITATIEPESQSITDRLQDTFFDADAPHRLPGFLLFLLIMIIAIFYLCGKDRRARYFGSALGSTGSKKKSFLASLLDMVRGRRNGPSYEIVMEEGNERLTRPEDFELSDIDSDDSEPSIQMNGKRTKGTKSSKQGPKPSTLSPDFLDRRGLAVRTESRERLDRANGRKSRTGSPDRTKGSAI